MADVGGVGDGSYVVVNLADRKPADPIGKVVAACVPGTGAIVKRLDVTPTGFSFKSLNPASPDVTISSVAVAATHNPVLGRALAVVSPAG